MFILFDSQKKTSYFKNGKTKVLEEKYFCLKQIRRKNATPNIKTQHYAYLSKDMIHVKCMSVFKSTSLFLRNLFYCVFLISNFSKITFFFCLSQAATFLRNLSILQKLFSPLCVCVFMLHFKRGGNNLTLYHRNLSDCLDRLVEYKMQWGALMWR